MQLPPDEVKPGAPEWVVTFGDMMSLLLTFFVLLLSFSTMEASKFKTIAGYVREAFGVQDEFNYTGVPMGTTILSTATREQAPASDELDLVQLIRQKLEKAKVDKESSVSVTERGVAVRVEGGLLFDSGRAELKSGALTLLDTIAEMAASQAGHIEVEGHTDDVPITSSIYPSNWELASARAGAAARYLLKKGVPPSRIRAVGYADTQPLAPNDSTENRSRNRRVEFLFVKQPKKDDARPEPPESTGGFLEPLPKAS